MKSCSGSILPTDRLTIGWTVDTTAEGKLLFLIAWHVRRVRALADPSNRCGMPLVWREETQTSCGGIAQLPARRCTVPGV